MCYYEYHLFVRMRLFIQNWLKGPYTLMGDESITKNEPVPHKWLPGDEVDADGAVLNRTPPKQILGIVHFVNRTGYGFSPRGAPLYMFYPLHTGYPPFLVSSKTKPSGNMIASVSYEHWNDKWPRGGIQRLLGAVGDKSAERQALLQTAAVGSTDTGDVAEFQLDCASHDTTPWEYVFNIDPEGCHDVDDVFAWRKTGDGSIEFAIAIADVRTWVNEDSVLDKVAYERGTTFYDNGQAVLPMLPPALSAGAASLLADGVGRPVLALVYTIRNGVCISHMFRQCIMTVSKAYTYENVLCDTTVCTMLVGYLTTILGPVCGTDPHHWVELAMVDYNRRVAEVLRRAGVGLLRTHAGVRSLDWESLALKTGCADLAFFGYASGSYVDSTVDDSSHSGLGLKCYTHASSPLRRYADLYNQRWFCAAYFGLSNPQYRRLPILLNERNKLAKKLDRALWFLDNLDTSGITTVEGWALVEKTGGVWSVYVPSWKRKVRGIVSQGLVDAGTRVQVRAYTDLKATSLEARVVCSIAAL